MDRKGYESIRAALQGLDEVVITPVPEPGENATYVTVEYAGATTAGMVMSALYRAKLLQRNGPRPKPLADLKPEPSMTFQGALTFEDSRPWGGYRK